MELQKLTVRNYDELPENEKRITLSPDKINLVAAGIEDIKINGRALRQVTVLFLDGGSVDLVVDHADLELLEGAIGSFCLGPI
jgi:hypothetical protein